MINSVRKHAARVSLLCAALVIGTAAVAVAATLESSATVSSDSTVPSSVSEGENSFQIRIWATGNIPNDRSGTAQIVKNYSMSTTGTITAGSAAADRQTVTFDDNYNYSDAACASATPDSSQKAGCRANPFVISANLSVASGTPAGTAGTLVVSMTGSQSLDADPTPYTGYVEVAGGGGNNPPTVDTAAQDANGTEGDTLQASGSFTDADNDALALSADNTEGTFTDNGDGTWSWSLATTDDVAGGTITVTADDGNGGTVTDSFDYSAANADPVLGALNLGGTNCSPTIGGSFTDVGTGDTHTGSVDWGDGSTDDVFTSSPFGPFTHNYAGAGTYTITVEVSDDDFGSDSDNSTSHTVYNTNTGIDQPINANGTSVFKLNSTVPVKTSVNGCSGPVSLPPGSRPEVSVKKLAAGVEGTTNEASSTSAADSGTQMREDTDVAGKYIYNLATKGLSGAGTYRLRISHETFEQDIVVDLGVRK